MATNSKELKLVRIGIGLLLATHVVLAAYIILLFSAPMLVSKVPGFATIYFWLLLYGSIIVLVVEVLTAVGQSLVLALPRESRATGMALLALACYAVAIIATGLDYFIRIPQWLSTSTGAVSFLGMVLQVLWIRKAAMWRGRPDIASTAGSSLYYGAGSVVCWVVVATASRWLPVVGRQNELAGIFLFSMPFLLLICVILGYMRFIRSLRLLQLALGA
ncbi:MAG: hypothetical protein U0996_23120 [Planctomycetaceae bacterium]